MGEFGLGTVKPVPMRLCEKNIDSPLRDVEVGFEVLLDNVERRHAVEFRRGTGRGQAALSTTGETVGWESLV